jgi:hypothetical protein
MRLSIRAKQIAGVTAIVGVTVVVLSALYLARLAGVIVDESYSRAQILGYTILHRVSQLDIDPADRYAALKNDSGLRSILDSSIYDQSVVNAAIVDTNGIIVLHREPLLVGQQTPGNLGNLQALADADWITRLAVIYSS